MKRPHVQLAHTLLSTGAESGMHAGVCCNTPKVSVIALPAVKGAQLK